MRIWQYTRLDVKGIGGVEKHIYEVSAALRRMGHQVHIGDTPPWVDGEFIIHTHGDLWPNPITLARIKKHAHARWINVCHGTSIGRVLACHEYLSLSGWRGSARDFTVAALADAEIAVGKQALSEVNRFYRIKKPITVIQNGADPAIFRPLEKISDFPRLIFIGRPDDRVKNVPSLIEACTEVYRRRPSLELWAAPMINLPSPFLRSLGPLYGLALAETMSKCKALVLCSYYEGNPLVVHEAMSLGIPIIASAIPALQSALEGYPNAVFIDPRNIHDMSEKIETLLFEGKVPRPTPHSRSWDQVASEFISFYNRLM